MNIFFPTGKMYRVSFFCIFSLSYNFMPTSCMFSWLVHAVAGHLLWKQQRILGEASFYKEESVWTSQRNRSILSKFCLINYIGLSLTRFHNLFQELGGEKLLGHLRVGLVGKAIPKKLLGGGNMPARWPGKGKRDLFHTNDFKGCLIWDYFHSQWVSSLHNSSFRPRFLLILSTYWVLLKSVNEHIDLIFNAYPSFS